MFRHIFASILIVALSLGLPLSVGHTQQCAAVGKRCSVDGVGAPQCCADAGACVDHSGLHCDINATPQPTIAPDPDPTSSATSSAIRPPRTATPKPRATPVGALKPEAYSPGDLGLKFPSSQAVNYDPHTGQRANQYQALVRVNTLHWVVMPDVLTLFRDVPSCQSQYKSVASGMITAPGKFLILYSLQPLRNGQPYDWHPNYLWDLPQNIFAKLQACLLDDPVTNVQYVNEDMRELTDLRVEDDHLVEGNFTYSGVTTFNGGTSDPAGRLDPDFPDQPLTDAQCEAKDRAVKAHHDHAQALLAHDDALAAQLAPAVRARLLEFKQLARTVREQTLFELIFAGGQDPQAPQEYTDYWTAQTHEFMHFWSDGFHCDTDRIPDDVQIWEGFLGHARAHFFRRHFSPQNYVRMREVCADDIHYCAQSSR